jgi:hypothetical protein
MEKPKPLLDEDGEVRELTLEDFRHFKPVSEVLPPSLMAKLTARRHGPRKARAKERATNIIEETKMKTLDVQARLEYARAGVAVLRALQIRSATMRYNEFGKAIGLIPDEEHWQAWHQQQVAGILRLIAAAEKQAGKKTGVAPIEFDRILNEKGMPGAGIRKPSRIVIG